MWKRIAVSVIGLSIAAYMAHSFALMLGYSEEVKLDVWKKAIATQVEKQLSWVIRSLWLPLQLVLLVLVHSRLLLKDYGAERLFWEERVHVQFFSLFGTGLVVATALFTWFLLDNPETFIDATRTWPEFLSLLWIPPITEQVYQSGRFAAVGMIAMLALILAIKGLQTASQPSGKKWRFARSRQFFLPGLAGYLSSMGLIAVLHLYDHKPVFRFWFGWAIVATGLVIALLFILNRRRTAIVGRVQAGTVAKFWCSLGVFLAVTAMPLVAQLRFDNPQGEAGDRGQLVRWQIMQTQWFYTLAGWGKKEKNDHANLAEANKEPPTLQAAPQPESPLVGRRMKLPYEYNPARSHDPNAHAVGCYLTAVALFLIVYFLVFAWVQRSVSPRYALNPALLVSLALVYTDLVLGFVTFHQQTQIVSGLAFILFLVALNWVSAWWNYRYRFPGLDDALYAKPRPLPKDAGYPAHPNPAPLLDDEETLGNHIEALGNKKLILIATSGGGIRAAVWTASLLEQFDTKLHIGKEWQDRVRLVTGASGGMVGAAAWLGSLGAVPQGAARMPDELGPLPSIAGTDALRPLVQTMIQRDLLTALLWPPSAKGVDRGRELEKQWEFAAEQYFPGAANPFRKTFAEFRDRERAGTFPSIVFAPTAIEDNRRWLISNLDLKWFAEPVLCQLAAADIDRRLSRSCYELFKLFPEAHARLSLATATRMNATFPIVGPLVPLPTDPPRRLIDAGLYDNYGVEFLAHWMLQHEKLLKTSAGVVLIEIRAFPLREPGLDPVGPRGYEHPDMRSASSTLAEAAALISGPLGALFRGRSNITHHRNSSLLLPAAKALGKKLNRVVFELDEEASLSWYLSSVEKKDIEKVAQGGVPQAMARSPSRGEVAEAFAKLNRVL